MADEQTPAQKAYGDIAPALVEYSDKVRGCGGRTVSGQT